MLVDDDDAVARLGDDIGLVQLAARDAERIVDRRLGLRLAGRRRGARQGRRGDGEAAGAVRRERRLPGRHGFGEAAPAGAVRVRRAVGQGIGARPERAERCFRRGGRGAMAGGGQRMLERADDQPAHQAGVAEAHLGLRRMDIDVDQLGRHLEEQRHHGMAVARQEILIGAAHGALQQPVAHRAAVDEEILILRGAARIGRQGGEAGQRQALALRLDGQGIVAEFAAHDGGEPLQPAGRRVAAVERQRRDAERDLALAVGGEMEGDLRMGHGEAVDRVLRMHQLGARRLHELEPRRGGEEQVAHLDAGALGMGGRLRRAFASGVDRDAPGRFGAARPRGDGETAHRADRGQCLAAEAERADMGEIVVGQLRGGVAFDRQGDFVGAHADAVVRDRDEAQAAVAQLDVDARGARVDGVLDQFLDAGRRPFDHLAGGDAVDQALGQQPDGHAVRVPFADCAAISPRYWRASTLPSSTAGWSNGSTPSRSAVTIVSSM